MSSCSSSLEQVQIVTLLLSTHAQASGALSWPCSEEEKLFLLFRAGPSECAGPQRASPELQTCAVGQELPLPTVHLLLFGTEPN